MNWYWKPQLKMQMSTPPMVPQQHLSIYLTIGLCRTVDISSNLTTASARLHCASEVTVRNVKLRFGEYRNVRKSAVTEEKKNRSWKTHNSIQHNKPKKLNIPWFFVAYYNTQPGNEVGYLYISQTYTQWQYTMTNFIYIYILSRHSYPWP